MSDEQAEIRALAEAEERAIPHGLVHCLELGGISFDRASFEPGWRWSEHAEEDWCRQRHHGYLVAGRMRFLMQNGTEHEAAAGDVYLIPAGHDSWVVGDEPCVALDLHIVT